MNTESREARKAKRLKERRLEPVPPAHLFGADAIALFFRVGRRTVKRWISEGAPISKNGARYDAWSLDIHHWLLRKASKGAVSKNLSTML